MSLHLPHLIDSSGSLTPAALIPFCAYQTNMTVLGQERLDLPFQPCNKFKPTVLEGQLCYSLDMSTIEKEKSKVGVGAGLMIFLDQGNNNGNTQNPDFSKHFTDEFRTLDLDASEDNDNSVRIYLNTLSSFTDSRSGSYALSSLKKMTGTDGFLQQTDAQKKCRNELFEDCQTELYIDTVQKKCGCVPWALSSALPAKVFFFINIINLSFILRFFKSALSATYPATQPSQGTFLTVGSPVRDSLRM